MIFWLCDLVTFQIKIFLVFIDFNLFSEEIKKHLCSNILIYLLDIRKYKNTHLMRLCECTL